MDNFGNYLTLEKPRNFILRKRRSYLEIGAVFGIVPRLLFWAIIGRPTTDKWRHSYWVSQVSGVGPSNMSPKPCSVCTCYLGLPSTCAIGPEIRARGEA